MNSGVVQLRRPNFALQGTCGRACFRVLCSCGAAAVILVTGASSGIGAELARQLAPRALRLVLTARRTEQHEALRREMLKENPRLDIHVEPCDLSDTEATAAWAAEVAARFGPIDVLINNAGFGGRAPYDLADWEKVHRMVRVNVVAPALLTHTFVGTMVDRGRGGVLNIGSGAGLALMPAAAAYVGTKHFLHGFTEVLRLDLTGTGVVVTEVCPGPVETEFDEQAGIDSETGGGLPPTLKITAEQCAREAIAGFEKGEALVFPGRAYNSSHDRAIGAPASAHALGNAETVPASPRRGRVRGASELMDIPARPLLLDGGMGRELMHRGVTRPWRGAAARPSSPARCRRWDAAIDPTSASRPARPDSSTTSAGWLASGAQIVGGCCGIGPEHIASLRAKIEERTPVHRPA